MTDNLIITRTESESGGRYEAIAEGREGIGEMTYSKAGENRIIVDHTFVDGSLRGLGVGQQLAVRLVADARAEGKSVVALCPFFKSQAAKHSDWSDVVVA